MNKSDRRIILPLLGLGVVAIGVIFLVGGKESETETKTSQQVAVSSDSIDKKLPSDTYYQQEERQVERFAFDPNTADSTALLRLGLQPWQVRNIYKYRAAGGVYRKKEDFARLYGLTVKQYRELEPYITISADYLPAATLFPRNKPVTEANDSFVPRYPVKMAEGETIDLAQADTTQLRTVPGIGSYYARRIVDYGNRLGGYVSLSQLDEIDDFPQEAKAYLTLDNPEASIRKININRLSLNELKQHPYINFYQARAIVDYRRQHGAIADLDELHLLPDFPPEAISRLRPYVDY